MWRIWTRLLDAGKHCLVFARHTRTVFAAALLVSALLLVACAPKTDQKAVHNDTFSVGHSPKLVVKSDGGRVDVSAGPAGVIVVQSSLQNPDMLTYKVTREGDTITVAATQLPGLRLLANVNSPRADITVTAPGSTFIDLATSNGDVVIEGMRASGTLNTSNGTITLEDIIGDFDGATTDGEINISSMVGNASLETTNGAVNVKRGKGAFELATSNGTIYFQGELTPGGKNGFLTSNGNVVVKLDADPSLRVLASATNGSVVSSLALASGSQDDNSFSGVIGTGQAELIISAANGSVTLD